MRTNAGGKKRIQKEPQTKLRSSNKAMYTWFLANVISPVYSEKNNVENVYMSQNLYTLYLNSRR